MTDSVPPSQYPEAVGPRFTPEEVAYMKAQAMNEAVQRVGMRQMPQQQPPKVIYQRRNLTVAEWLGTLLVAVVIVAGFQGGWYIATDLLPRIEIRQR